MTRFGPFAALAFVLAMLGAPASSEETIKPPTVRLPGMAPIPLPPRGQGLAATPGNDEPATDQGLTPSQGPPKAGETDKDKDDAAPPRTRAETLNDLYARLAASKDEEETLGLIRAIDRLQLDSGSDAGDLLMARAIAAMGIKNYDVALALLDKLVDLYPDWAEAWNKRATARYLVDDDKGSMADIAHVLKLEPRHFGALSGMGLLFERQGMREDALRAYRRALEIAPLYEPLKNSVDRLTKAVEGQDL